MASRTCTERKILRFVVEPSEEFQGDMGLSKTQIDQLLALRGLLAYGVLEHCLCRRHRVDFGINRASMTKDVNQKKIQNHQKTRRIAVPFRASDTPAVRAEYIHPDTMIVFTHLAYYDDGISKPEMLEAIQILLKLGQKCPSRGVPELV